MYYDVAVVGAGLIGSACAKYAGALGAKTVLVGPREDQREETSLHGAWFDEGRIARKSSPEPHWQELGAECSATD
jgi:sarcosine oxidase